MKNFIPKDNTGLDLDRKDGYEISTTGVHKARQVQGVPATKKKVSGGLFGREGKAAPSPKTPPREDAFSGWEGYDEKRTGAPVQEEFELTARQESPAYSPTQGDYGTWRKSGPENSAPVPQDEDDENDGTWSRLKRGELRLAFALAFALPFLLLPSYALIYGLLWVKYHPLWLFEIISNSFLATNSELVIGLYHGLDLLLLLLVLFFLRVLFALWRCVGKSQAPSLARNIIRLLLLGPVFQLFSGLNAALGLF